MLKKRPHPLPVPGLLDHTTRWLTQAATDLATPPPPCPDTPDSSSATCLPAGEAAISPEPLSPKMILSQGFLNLLLWDGEDEAFPEVGLAGGRRGTASPSACRTRLEPLLS